MSRALVPLLALLIILTLLAAAVVAILGFGRGEQKPPRRLAVQRLDAPVRVHATESEGLIVEADSETDLYFGLGFAQASTSAWSMAILRQTALGRLSEWFGQPVLRLDEHVRRLGFSRAAEQAFLNLNESDTEVLVRFAEGVSLGLSQDHVLLDPSFALFRLEPEPWLPEHSLAVEQMLAWLSAPVTRVDSLLQQMVTNTAFLKRDDDLRKWLHLNGMEYSAAWAQPTPDGPRWTARLVYGATVEPLYRPVHLRWNGLAVNGLSLLATPFLPVVSGRSQTRIILASSPRRIEAIPDDAQLEVRHERLVDPDRNETLLTIRHDDGRLVLRTPPSAPGSVSDTLRAVLAWPGRLGVSDWPAWRASVHSAAGVRDTTLSFELITGDGLLCSEPVGCQVVESPVVEVARPGLVFVGQHEQLAYAGERLTGFRADSNTYRDSYSVWAEQTVQQTLDLMVHESISDPTSRLALDYVQNWDFEYATSSIGAAIFDSWMAAFPAPTYPLQVPLDSVQRVLYRAELTSAFLSAVDTMRNAAGPDLAQWRLERIRPGRRYFGVWSWPELKANLPSINRRKFSPISIGQPGHPTSLAWQPSVAMSDDELAAPSHVLASGYITEPARVQFKPDFTMSDGLFARYMVGSNPDWADVGPPFAFSVTLSPFRP